MSQEISTVKLDNKTAEIAQKIINTDDINTVSDLTHLFNLNQAKKNVVRVIKLSGLMDTVSDKIIERFEKYPDNFSNADLLNYLQVSQNAIEKVTKNLNMVDDTPPIQLMQQNNVNVNIIDSLDRESKDRITNALKSILQKTQQPEDDTNKIIELIEDDTNG